MSSGTATPASLIPAGGLLSAGLTIADRYGPTGLLVTALCIGMWFTTTWLRDESSRNNQIHADQQDKFVSAIKEHQSRFDTMLEREHREFRDSLNSITKSFQDAMARKQ